MNKLLTIMIFCSFLNCQGQSKSLIGIWQCSDNPNYYLIIDNQWIIDIDYLPKSKTIVKTRYLYKFTDDCGKLQSIDLKNEGYFLVQMDQDDPSKSVKNYICQSFSFPTQTELYLQLWASNQNITFKRLHAVPTQIKGLLNSTKEIQKVTITTPKSYFYQDASEAKPRKAFLLKGDTAFVEETKGDWLLLRYEGKTTTRGWMHKKNVREVK